MARRLVVLGLAAVLVALPGEGPGHHRPALGVPWSWPEDGPPPAAEPWGALTLLAVSDPRQFGAVGDGVADDTAALQATIDGLPEGGGVVWMAPGLRFRFAGVIRITEDHVKLWAPGGSELLATTNGADRQQAIVIEGTTGAGLYGLRLSSDATRRRYALEDSAVAIVDAVDTEVMGLDIENSAGPAIFVFDGSTRTSVRGNVIHDTWADGVHFTDGSRQAWVWGNTFVTADPRPGDDGIACVTYGGGDRCGQMEWWQNLHRGNDWGRGLSVVGGDHIEIHHNLVMDTAGAGILVASEPDYDTPGSDQISIHDNVVVGAGRVIPHPGVLLSGLSGPITRVTVHDNTILATGNGEAFRAEGEVTELDEGGTVAGPSRPAEVEQLFPPVAPGAVILGTRDASFVAEGQRRGLSRIRVRPAPDAAGLFQQQLEYLVVGPPAELDDWIDGPDRPHLAFRAPAGAGEEVALVRADRPLTIPRSLRPLTFAEVRSDRRWRDLPGLWAAVDSS